MKMPPAVALFSRRNSPRCRRNSLKRARQKGELKTVRRIVFNRGKPCDRGLSPVTPHKIILKKANAVTLNMSVGAVDKK